MRCSANHRSSAFTLAEVLAALALMAIVIPVAVQGVQLASRAGQVGVRKATAARIADRVLGELEVTGQLLSGTQNGVIREGGREFTWRMASQSWLEAAALDVVTVRVAFEVQGEEYHVQLSTLVDPNVAVSTATSTGTAE
jgi:prepilin-type N-terminal cleavage/methylation domain-containing protein